MGGGAGRDEGGWGMTFNLSISTVLRWAPGLLEVGYTRESKIASDLLHAKWWDIIISWKLFNCSFFLLCIILILAQSQNQL